MIKPEKFHFVYGQQETDDVDPDTVRFAQNYYALFMNDFDLRPWKMGDVHAVMRELPLDRVDVLKQWFDTAKTHVFQTIDIGSYKTKFVVVFHVYTGGKEPRDWFEENIAKILPEVKAAGMDMIGWPSWIHPGHYAAVGITKFTDSMADEYVRGMVH